MTTDLKRCTLGVVVKYNPAWRDANDSKPLDWELGHVMGFARNSTDEIILKIQTDREEIVSIHPVHVQLDW